MPDASPVEIRRVADREIHVTWSDGHRSVFPNKMLRERCPCAGCVHELTGRRLLDPRSVREDIRAEEIALVGRYAIRVRWSDGHGDRDLHVPAAPGVVPLRGLPRRAARLARGAVRALALSCWRRASAGLAAGRSRPCRFGTGSGSSRTPGSSSRARSRSA